MTEKVPPMTAMLPPGFAIYDKATHTVIEREELERLRLNAARYNWLTRWAKHPWTDGAIDAAIQKEDQTKGRRA